MMRLRALISMAGFMLLAMSSSAQPIRSGDRVYTADQTSNTVSVIDPVAEKLLGVISLGDPVPASLSPLYKGQLLVHGLGFSPDHRTVAVVSIGSNAVTLIDTATNKVRGTVYVGRSPHEAFFTPDGRELWIAIRGEDYVSVIDPASLKEVRRIQTANGPAMVLFRPDGRYAFVPSSFTPELDVIDMKTYQVAARVKQSSPFSPNLAVSADGTEVWFTLKDTGRTQVIQTEPPFSTIAILETGPISNHVALIENSKGKFAYVTVGGLDQVKVFRRGSKPEQVGTIHTGDLPHGIWGSGDGTRVYVGLENGDAVQAIDTATNRVIATIPVGQLPQALVYVPGAVPSGDGSANLSPPAQIAQASHLTLIQPNGSGPKPHASVVVNSLGAVDQLQIAAYGLEPGREYEFYLSGSLLAPYQPRELLGRFKANADGSAIAQAIGPIRKAVSVSTPSPNRRYVIVTPAGDGAVPVLVQKNE